MKKNKRDFSKTRFYQARRLQSISIVDSFGNMVDIKERGLDECCEGTNDKHQWLRFPSWTECVEQGGKDYLICLNCMECSHL